MTSVAIFCCEMLIKRSRAVCIPSFWMRSKTAVITNWKILAIAIELGKTVNVKQVFSKPRKVIRSMNFTISCGAMIVLWKEIF